MSKKAHMRINPVLSQYDFERDVRDCLKHGHIKQIAEILGHSDSYIEQQFNPHDDRQSVLYKALQCVAAIDMIDEDTGEEVMNIFLRHRTKAKESNPIVELERALDKIRAKIASASAERKEVQ